MEKLTYDEVKLNKLQRNSTIRIFGKPLEQNFKSVIGISENKRGRIVIDLCFCVHDNPPGSCKCPSNIMIWMTTDDIISSGEVDGKDMYYFDIKRDSELLMEELIPFKAPLFENYKKRKSTSINANVSTIDLDIMEYFKLIYAPINNDNDCDNEGTQSKIFGRLISAFKAGWKVGKALDKAFNISDYIADKLCEADPKCE